MKEKYHKNKIYKILDNVKDGFVCIFTEQLTDKDLIEQIYHLSQNSKTRFYILVNNYNRELDVLNKICLIRYVVSNVHSFFLVNPKTNTRGGLFFTGQFTEQSLSDDAHISFYLNNQEITELFHFFCYQFWEKAKEEVIDGEHKDINSKSVDVFSNINFDDCKKFLYQTLFTFIEKEKRKNIENEQIVFLNDKSNFPKLEIKMWGQVFTFSIFRLNVKNKDLTPRRS